VLCYVNQDDAFAMITNQLFLHNCFMSKCKCKKDIATISTAIYIRSL